MYIIHLCTVYICVQCTSYICIQCTSYICVLCTSVHVQYYYRSRPSTYLIPFLPWTAKLRNQQPGTFSSDSLVRRSIASSEGAVSLIQRKEKIVFIRIGIVVVQAFHDHPKQTITFADGLYYIYIYTNGTSYSECIVSWSNGVQWSVLRLKRLSNGLHRLLVYIGGCWWSPLWQSLSRFPVLGVCPRRGDAGECSGYTSGWKPFSSATQLTVKVWPSGAWKVKEPRIVMPISSPICFGSPATSSTMGSLVSKPYWNEPSSFIVFSMRRSSASWGRAAASTTNEANTNWKQTKHVPNVVQTLADPRGHPGHAPPPPRPRKGAIMSFAPPPEAPKSFYFIF